MDRDLGDVLALARRQKLRTALDIAEVTGCGDQCGSCRPYIVRMLQTGRVPTTADLMSAEDAKKFGGP
ncbi:MAG: (2Fe-2S)-binding protein [Phycisphaerae bacterium]|nr:(2Fe-2S)-binding protein [Phycisphaerae bacterium]